MASAWTSTTSPSSRLLWGLTAATELKEILLIKEDYYAIVTSVSNLTVVFFSARSAKKEAAFLLRSNCSAFSFAA